MLDVAIRKADGTTAVDLGRRAAPPLPVYPALEAVLPTGLTRGSTVTVTGSVSLLLALLGAASSDGAWCALVGFPVVGAEAACEYGIDLSRLAFVPRPGSGWVTAVGALLDAVDIVAVRPPAERGTPALAPGDIRRLAARARTRDAVLMPYTDAWPGADVRLTAAAGEWTGIGSGTGRLRARRLAVRAEGRGSASRPRTATLWLPAGSGGVSDDERSREERARLRGQSPSCRPEADERAQNQSERSREERARLRGRSPSCRPGADDRAQNQSARASAAGRLACAG